MNDLETLGDTLSVARSTPTLRQQAVEKLRRAIIEGRLSPGSRLVERKLCEILGVSRTVVRELLRQLEAEGWVVNSPYRGLTVATVGPDEARQIYEIRTALEGAAARLCAVRATPVQVGRLEEVVAAMAEASAHGDLERHLLLIESFYERLMEGADNAMMSAYLASQRSRVARLRSISLGRPQRAGISIEEKRNLVAAIRAGDPECAQRLAEAHVRASAQAAFETFERTAGRGTPDAGAPAEKPRGSRRPPVAVPKPARKPRGWTKTTIAT